MKLSSILPLAVVFTSTFAIAEANFIKPLTIDPAQCPVDLHAKHGTGLPVGLNAAGPAVNGKPLEGKTRPQAITQAINLSITNRSLREIVSFEVTAHGFSNNGRYVPLSAAPQKSDLAKTVEIAVHVKANGVASRELSFAHFAAVSAIDVKSITYADGSTWHSASAAACSVTPDNIMLLSETR